jgi:hypothetical protein
MTPAQLQELRRRIADAHLQRDYVVTDWNNALDWIESQIMEVIGDPAFTNGDGPVTREEFEKVVGG